MNLPGVPGISAFAAIPPKPPGPLKHFTGTARSSGFSCLKTLILSSTHRREAVQGQSMLPSLRMYLFTIPVKIFTKSPRAMPEKMVPAPTPSNPWNTAYESTNAEATNTTSKMIITLSSLILRQAGDDPRVKHNFYRVDEEAEDDGERELAQCQ